MEVSRSSGERIDTSDYVLFADVAESGNLAAAARRLGISAPMASKRLARLEQRLGTRLLHRTTRRLALTGPGARFHDDVLAILSAVAAAERRVSGLPGVPQGPLKLAAPTSFGRLHIAPHLGGFLEAYPAVELTLDLSDGFSDLIGERVDLAIRITAEVPAQLSAHRLATSHRILCAAPAYIDRHGAPGSVEDLAHHRLLAADGQLPWRLVDKRRLRLVEGTSAVRTNSSEVVRELALAGIGIALRSLWDVYLDLRAGRLMRVLPDFEGSANVGIFAVHQRTPLLAANVTAMIDYLEALYGADPPWQE